MRSCKDVDELGDPRLQQVGVGRESRDEGRILSIRGKESMRWRRG